MTELEQVICGPYIKTFWYRDLILYCLVTPYILVQTLVLVAVVLQLDLEKIKVKKLEKQLKSQCPEN